jgi:putative protease
MDEQPVGRVTHYYGRIQVATVEVTDSDLQVGDTIRVLGSTTNFTQQVASMEIDHTPVQSVQVGDLVGIEVSERARVNDLVYRSQHR